MLTMAKLKEGEGKFNNLNPEIGHATRRKKMKNDDIHK